MARYKFYRITQYRNIMRLISCVDGFEHRDYGVGLVKTGYCAIVLLVCLILGVEAAHGVMDIDMTTDMANNVAFSLMSIGTFFAAIVVTFIYYVTKMSNTVTATEFQSLLFSEAVRQGKRFLMIIGMDRVIYIDKPAREMFCSEVADKEFSDLRLSSVLEGGFFPKNLRTRLDKSMTSNETFSGKYKLGSEELVVSCSPIDRAEGFFVLSGENI